jgi:hypothetical protein
VGHPDYLTAEAVRISMEIWNKATGNARDDVRVVVYRCGQCKQLHVGRRQRKKDPSKLEFRSQTLESARPTDDEARPINLDHAQNDRDIRYLIEEFDLN